MFLFSPHDAKVSFFAQVLPMLVHQPPNSKSPVPFEFRVMEQILIEVVRCVAYDVVLASRSNVSLLRAARACVRPSVLTRI